MLVGDEWTPHHKPAHWNYCPYFDRRALRFREVKSPARGLPQSSPVSWPVRAKKPEGQSACGQLRLLIRGSVYGDSLVRVFHRNSSDTVHVLRQPALDPTFPRPQWAALRGQRIRTLEALPSLGMGGGGIPWLSAPASSQSYPLFLTCAEGTAVSPGIILTPPYPTPWLS